MTSIAAATTRPHVTPTAAGGAGRRAGLREAPWVRAALGVTIAGLLVADLSVVLRERAEAAAAGRGPAPALEVRTASESSGRVPAAPAATSEYEVVTYEVVTFDDALSHAVGTSSPAPAAEEAPVGSPVATAAPGGDPVAPVSVDAVPATGAPGGALPTPPRAGAPAAPATTPPGSSGPSGPSVLPPLVPTAPLPPLADPGPAVTGLLESVPVVGPVVAPAVGPVVEPVVAEAAPLAPSGAGDSTAPAGGLTAVVDAVAEPVTAPVSRTKLLG